MSYPLRFKIDSATFRNNQDVSLEFVKSACKFTINQEHSTPGIRLVQAFSLPAGDYELNVRARASISEVFFLWVFNCDTNTRIGGTVHVGLDLKEISVGFSLSRESTIDLGVLSHKQTIGDNCKVELVEVNPLIFNEVGGKPQSLEPNQLATLQNCLSHWVITSEQERSTPGCRMAVNVEPGKLHAITVDMQVRSVTAATFLWAYSRDENRELLPRVHVFPGGAGANRTSRTVYIDVPDGIHEILVGVLFSSAGLKIGDSFDLHTLKIEPVTTLSDVATAGYVLNLDGEEERFEYCQHMLKKEGFLADRWRAVRGADEPYLSDYNDYFGGPFNEEDLKLGRKAIQSSGAWGYLLTMREILVDAIEKKHPCIAVFDDDIILTYDFTLRFSRFIANVPAGWEVLMLGASQWNWTGIKPDLHQRWYVPNQMTNGSFATIYRSSTYQRLVDAIDKMDSPFDSKPLKDVTCDGSGKSYVAWPNIVIADVEKEGIRDSRDQEAYASRFRWRLRDYHTNYKLWRANPVLMFDRIPDNWAQTNKPHLVLGVTTINRWDYLQQFITTWKRTRSKEVDWTLIVADDGSTDGTVENLLSIRDSGARIILIQNSGDGIARQTNSIFSYAKEMHPTPNLIFSADDDIFFKSRGWDLAYLKAIQVTGMDHLVHFNPTWKEPIHVVNDVINEFELLSMTDAISCMGCFYTVTPALLEMVGAFDELAFPIRGHSHIDFTMRCCRAEYNKQEHVFDIADSCKMIGIHPKEGYTPTLRRYTFTEQMTLADPHDKERRWRLVKSDGRIHVDFPNFRFLDPSQSHLRTDSILRRNSISNKRQENLNDVSVGSKSNFHKSHNIPPDSTYNHHERWSFEGSRLTMTFEGREIWWDMPENYEFEEAHPDLFKLAEYVLLSPYDEKILKGWIPSRKPGFRPGLAFSCGVDSTAAMALLPQQTVLFYHERDGFDTILNHANAHRFIEYIQSEISRPVVVVKSNHESLRTLSEKSPGFVTDYACAVHCILLADHYSLDSIATGMPLENSYLWHGQEFRHFEDTWFWKRHAPLFESVGLPILQPVMGCSENINREIVDKSGFGDFAQSCLRAEAGESCGCCWKCFRKNSIRGEDVSLSREIETFLGKEPLKMAASTIHSLQLMSDTKLYAQIIEQFPHIANIIDEDVSFLNGYYSPAFNLMPEKYRAFVEKRLKLFANEIDSPAILENFCVYD